MQQDKLLNINIKIIMSFPRKLTFLLCKRRQNLMLAIYFSRKPCLQALIEIRTELAILNEVPDKQQLDYHLISTFSTDMSVSSEWS